MFVVNVARTRLHAWLAALIVASTIGSAAMADDGAAAAPSLEFAFEITAELGETLEMGETPYGGRRDIPIVGGSVEGPVLNGEVLSGGSDYQLVRPDGVIEIVANYMVQAEDGTLIRVNNKGIVVLEEGKIPFVRTTPVLEAPIGPHEDLNKKLFVGTLQRALDRPAVIIRVYEIK